MKLTHVRLLADDFQSLLAFYRDVVGLEVSWGQDGVDYAELSMPGTDTLIAIYDREAMAQAVGGRLEEELEIEPDAEPAGEAEAEIFGATGPRPGQQEPAGVAAGFTDWTDTCMFVFSVDDLDATVAALQRRGVVFEAGPLEIPAWGVRAAQFRDPEGNLLEVSQSLGA